MTNIDYLTEDNILPDHQKFVCLSFLTKTDDDTQKFNIKGGIKIRGVFSTYELACEYAKKVQSIDTYFNVYVGEMGKWLEFDPDPNSIKESEYANEELNSMMKSYLENQEKAKIFHEHRKNELIRNNILDNLNTRRDNLKDLHTKIKEAVNEDEKQKLESSVNSIEDQIKKLDDKKKNLDKQIEELDNQLHSFKQQPPSNPKIITRED
jgi:chromosome condensin MukBEF ATPase and DNA-binding subunit MukB